MMMANIVIPYVDIVYIGLKRHSLPTVKWIFGNILPHYDPILTESFFIYSEMLGPETTL